MVLVGGGNVLVSRQLRSAADLHVPKHAEVANAVGAALAQVGGETDRIYSYDDLGRDGAIEQAVAGARTQAIVAGADPASVHLVDLEEIPLAYLRGGAVRLRAKVVGDLHIGDDGCTTAETDG